MTGTELEAALDQLGLAKRAFARMIRVNERTVRMWTAGDAAVPGPVQMLLELALLVQARAPDVDIKAWLATRAASRREDGTDG